MRDPIERQDAIEAMTNTLWHYPNECYRNLNEYEFAKGLAELGLKSVPSAQPDHFDGWPAWRDGERIPEDKSYYTADRETGTHIEKFATYQEALDAIRRYEEADQADGSFTPDFYDIVDADHCSIHYGIKEIRALTDLSQAKFSKAYGIPQRTLESWEMGERNPPDYVLSLLQRVVMMDVADVIEPERKNGKWIDRNDNVATCSVCGSRWGLYRLLNYCPNCGTRMEKQ